MKNRSEHNNGNFVPEACGRHMRNKREECGMTRENVSERFYLENDSASPTSIYHWEMGNKLPTIPHLVHLARVYKCSLDELVFGHRPAYGGDAGASAPPVYKYCFLLRSRLASLFLCRLTNNVGGFYNRRFLFNAAGFR